jgi:hypothetical protein
VGSLLLWDVKDENALDVMPVYGAEADKNTKKIAIVLDRQIFSSLYYSSNLIIYYISPV